MSAKAILKRYLERNSSTLPKEPVELRQKVTAVADEAKLVLTTEELDELAPVSLPPPPSEGEGERKKKKGHNSGISEAEVEKGSNATTEEI